MRKCVWIDIVFERALSHGSGGEIPRAAKVKIETPLLDQGSEGGNHVGLADAIMEILEDIHPKLFGRFDQRLKGIPSRDALSGACLQTHVSFADPLSGTELSWIVVQENSQDGKGP